MESARISSLRLSALMRSVSPAPPAGMACVSTTRISPSVFGVAAPGMLSTIARMGSTA